jgi:oligopeptide/dipeptide ABC transporter ATP-binding protein
MDDLLLDVKDLSLHIGVREGTVRAADGLSYQIRKGKVLGVVGESGSGKSFTAKALLRIEHPARIMPGSEMTYWSDRGPVRIDRLDRSGPEVRKLRWAEIAMIFQEPMTSLGPMHTIGQQIAEAIMLHEHASKAEANVRAVEVLASVGMPRPDETARQYPHQISGGMRQRAMIAMAMSCHPKLLIADEPTTALDVTTEAQILELLQAQQKARGMSILYISHNLAVIAQIADDVMVMYLGKIVEQADVKTLFADPKHPYTRALLRSIPSVDSDPGGRLATIDGAVPNPLGRPKGCAFHPRCSEAIRGLCDQVEPPNCAVSGSGTVRCHLYSTHVTKAAG